MNDLLFNASEIKALVLHSINSKDRRPVWGQQGKEVDPGLWLVKDEGIYLMSNGKRDLKTGEMHPVVYAENFRPTDDNVWERSHEISGDDFNVFIPTEKLTIPLSYGAAMIMLKVFDDAIEVHGLKKRRTKKIDTVKKTAKKTAKKATNK